MKQSVYRSYEELPLFLGAYELMHEKSFPVLQIGHRKVIPKEQFRTWVEQSIGGGVV